MVSGICQGVTSYLPKMTLVAGAAGLGFCAAGLPGVIAASGASLYYCYSRKTPPLQLPCSPKVMDADDHKEHFIARPIDNSARLFQPQGSPAKIIWKDNSCFCSSVTWAAFTNIPEIIGEIPEAIGRRWNENHLFPNIGGIEGVITPINEKILMQMAPVLRKKDALTLSDFVEMRKSLASLDTDELPPECQKRLKALLSLLELHQLIREFQTSSYISGDRVNSLREMVYRVNPDFEGTGTVTGDSHEVFQTLADLVFEGSSFQQELTTTRVGKGLNLSASTPNWGDFLLPMPREKGQMRSLQAIFERYLAPPKYDLPYGKPEKIYHVQETTRFERPPLFLALTMNRGEPSIEEEDLSDSDDDCKGLVAQMNMDPIHVEEQLTLEPKFSKNGQKGDYQLVGMSRHLGNFAHYDAIMRRPDGTWYYGDDLQKHSSVYPFNKAELSNTAKTGYSYYFRLVR